MKIVADESVDRLIVELLRSDGHQVDYIAEIYPSISDLDVLKLANKARAVLITADKDFGELIFRDHQETLSRVILLRLAGFTSERKAETVLTAIHDFCLDLENGFVVITKTGVRVHSE
jgi:predicted nuclease of predicted toxin-antitoxin system